MEGVTWYFILLLIKSDFKYFKIKIYGIIQVERHLRQKYNALFEDLNFYLLLQLILKEKLLFSCLVSLKF